ncbi:hypothetical protein BDW22DRAFT_445562 [Trametopsis cervina]|nr:hypothetical protein BDW22DRAFT_445562 [Trametopsis cervina]
MPSSRSRPSTANSSSSDLFASEGGNDQQPFVSTPRRRSSGASDISREREGSVSYFTPPTRSPLISSGQNMELPHSSPSPRTRSPASPFAIMNTTSTSTMPPPPRSPTSRPSTSGSSAAPRPVSPATVKRGDRKPPSSVQMPPPPVPSPVVSAPLPLPPKPEPHQPTTKTPSHSQPSASIPMFPRSNIPYAPRNRITPAGSVLVPLSPAELERSRTFVGMGSQLLRQHKRKREGETEQYPSKKTRDVGLIAGHYNARPEVDIKQRKDSPIIGLKNFNNWVKSVLITSRAHPTLAASENAGPLKHVAGPRSMRGPPRGSGKVLDMGCGKGGDLIKWNKARIREYVAVDIASVSIDQARKRYDELRMPKFSAYFTAADCYATSLSAALPDIILPPSGKPFDVVSMQFCMHYAFESEQKARTMMENVSAWLRPGGTFIGTTPNATWLLDHLDSIPKDDESLTFGNSVYSIRFEDRSRPLYGHRYWFNLVDAVDNVPEYVVHWDNFVKLADEYGLVPVYVKEFHEVFAENEDHKEFGPLLQNMRVVDANGESQMDEDQWEAANIYIAFAFEKRSR